MLSHNNNDHVLIITNAESTYNKTWRGLWWRKVKRKGNKEEGEKRTKEREGKRQEGRLGLLKENVRLLN